MENNIENILQLWNRQRFLKQGKVKTIKINKLELIKDVCSSQAFLEKVIPQNGRRYLQNTSTTGLTLSIHFSLCYLSFAGRRWRQKS